MSEPGFDRCPDCGARPSTEPFAAGLCLSCLLELGLSGDGIEPRPPVDDLPTGAPALSPGQILGNRYRIRSLLGSGGMGEVFRVFDLKLQVDVALKAVRFGLGSDRRTLDGLRHEVRAAREVVSPNVCRVFDLVELDGRELVSMEYVDGVTLAHVLAERSPLNLQEARDIASQFLAGLEAIHAAGLVHRDIKPENLMLTRAGRVVVMDFGIARAGASAAGATIAGTPAYMSPEQARGEALDPRADVFSAGVVLAEMVAPGGVRRRQAREAVWRSIHGGQDGGTTPWAPVLQMAVATARKQRYPTAAALARALEEITLRTTGDESELPYPGLASFTERDAGYFIGRELEIEEMWKKLRRPHLLALIGPSGAGKSSFLRAGLVPTAPPGWRIVVATPSDRPFARLAQALAPEVSGDVEAVARLIDFDQPDVAVDIVKRWRNRHEQVLLVFDQFEELFTQCPANIQARFAELLARLALEADARVLVSLRDDFLFHCQRFESLSPVFADLTAIGPPTGAALRRALVQPALKCGYRFEDETLVEEMLAQVAGERGALPLVAFAMARLWDRRDRERGLLTRAAYDEIGGVGGALAQHAEATLDRIGHDRLPIVRELFRNLVTSQGTRATLDHDELLSVFAGHADAPEAGGVLAPRQQAADVLEALIDARLLTSYELPSDEPAVAGRRRIEIVHESLLTAWPRLVRWRTQDQDGAQLRDQLRQAARLWEERDHPEDLLWTGTSYREYELWRERYAGTLSASEDRFARAMIVRALRRKRQRRLAMAAVVAAAIGVAATMGLLWRQSESARAEAITAARRAEAQQLLTLGQLDLVQHPSAAVAYALRSLERADSPHARQFALRALWQGPTAQVLAPAPSEPGPLRVAFSPDGEWLAVQNGATGGVRVWNRDGSPPRDLPGSGRIDRIGSIGFSGDSRALVVTLSDSVRVHALPSLDETRRIAGSFRWGMVRGQSVITGAFVDPTPDGRPRRRLRSFPLTDNTPDTDLGILTAPPGAPGVFTIDRTGHWMLGLYGGFLFETPLQQLADGRHRMVVQSDDPLSDFVVSPDGASVYSWGKASIGRAWSRRTGRPVPGPRLELGEDRSLPAAEISNDGRWLAAVAGGRGIQVWDLAGPVDADALAFRGSSVALSADFDPADGWIAVQDRERLSLWPLDTQHPRVLRGTQKTNQGVVIDPGGEWVAAGGPNSRDVTIWPVRGNRGVPSRTLDSGAPAYTLTVSPRGDLLAAGTRSGVWLVPVDGTPARQLPGFKAMVAGVAFDRDARRVAAGGGLQGDLVGPGEAVVRVWDLATSDVRVLDAGDRQPISRVAFMPDGRLLSSGLAGLRIWDLESGTSTRLIEGVAAALPSPDGRYLLGLRGTMRPGGLAETAFVYDLAEKRSWDLRAHGTDIRTIAWHPSGNRIVTASVNGVLRVGGLAGDEPHLLMGHEAEIWDVEVAPNGEWIASSADDGTVRLWRMPDEEPPFHTLPLAALLTRLRALTNYRVVEDPTSPSGYRIDVAPISGWSQKPPGW